MITAVIRLVQCLMTVMVFFVVAESLPAGEDGRSRHCPLWMELYDLSATDKANAEIRFEAPGCVDSKRSRELRMIEELWDRRDFDAAVDRLRALEEAECCDLAMGINWRVPRPACAGDWGGDVQVDGLGEVIQTRLDFDDATGNLFVVNRRDGGTNPRLVINLSTDDGATWRETALWYSSIAVDDMDAVVIGNFLYIGYAMESGVSAGRMRRVFTSSGLFDSSYGTGGFYVVLDIDAVDLREIAVASNEDNSADEIYYLAILPHVPGVDNLICGVSDIHGLAWTNLPTGIDDADHGLDATWNQDATSHDLVISWVDMQLNLSLSLKLPSGCFPWIHHLYIDHPVDGITAVSAYKDTIIVVYEYTSTAGVIVKYYLTTDYGGTYTIGTLAGTPKSRRPDVTARRGCGIGVIWHQEAGSFDPCYYSRSPYSSASWTDPVIINETDLRTGSFMSIECAPSIPGSADGHGACWAQGPPLDKFAFFDRTSFTLDVDPDPIVGASTATFTLTDAKVSTMTFLAYSLAGTGTYYIPPLGVTMGIRWPKQIGSPVMTDSIGSRIWTLPIPPAPSGLNVWLQAVQNRNMSNVVATSIL
jgi:hypothetical protein